MVIAVQLESKIVGNMMNSYQVLLIKWRKIVFKLYFKNYANLGEQSCNTDNEVNREGANFEKVDFL